MTRPAAHVIDSFVVQLQMLRVGEPQKRVTALASRVTGTSCLLNPLRLRSATMAIVVFEHDDTDPSGRLGAVLRNYGHRLRVIRLQRGDSLPVDLDDVDGIVSCGGAPSATDDSLPWLEPEMSCLREAHEAGVPIIAVCLGCHVLARALGGEVGKLEGGIELGWHPVKLTAAGRNDIVHAGIGWTTMQFHWHRDEVKEVPAGAQLLASSERTTVQAWLLGPVTYAFQYHPEVERSHIESWMRESPDALDEAGVSADDVRRGADEHYAAMVRTSERLFERIALLVTPVDRRFAGLAKNVHH